MEWKIIKGYENYKISSSGEVFSFNRDKLLAKQLDKYGYFTVNLYLNGRMKTKKIHRLVALMFIGESNLTINHIDNNKANNHFSNLEYVTIETNVSKAHFDGLIKTPKGKTHYRYKLTDEIKNTIIKMKKDGYSNSFIAEKFSIHPQTIYKFLYKD